MRIAYLDCFSGISGDMMLGALLDLGFPEAILREQLSRLPIEGYRIDVSPVRDHGIEAVQVKVMVEEDKQPHRHFGDIQKLIAKGGLTERARQLAEEIFLRLAQAEAVVHGVSVEKVHFHEVGAVDSIVDIVGVAIGIDFLGIEKCFVSDLPLGGGFVTCQHGVLPVPAPATVEILKDMRVKAHPAEMELVTPTGAAIASQLSEPGHPLLPPIRIEQVGYGAGSRRHEYPNLLRVIVGELEKAYEEDEVLLLECQVDDLQPEIYPYLMEKLLAAGAIDVCFIPVQMKKGRSGRLIQVFSEPQAQMPLAEILFSETTTLGIRWSRANRLKLARWHEKIDTAYGPISVKMVDGPGLKGPEIRPEFEACRQVATEKAIPLRKVYDEIQRASHLEKNPKDRFPQSDEKGRLSENGKQGNK